MPSVSRESKSLALDCADESDTRRQPTAGQRFCTKASRGGAETTHQSFLGSGGRLLDEDGPRWESDSDFLKKFERTVLRPVDDDDLVRSSVLEKRAQASVEPFAPVMGRDDNRNRQRWEYRRLQWLHRRILVLWRPCLEAGAA